MNLEPFIRRLKILDKYRGTIPFDLNWAQQEYLAAVHEKLNARQPGRFIILKARQLGISTLTEALLFTYSFVYPYNKSLVISHEQDSYEHLLGISKNYWNTFFAKSLYTTEFSSRKELKWVETQSSITTATAKNVDAGRSQTLHCLHGSEVGFWNDAETLLTGLRQTIPRAAGTFIGLESTANGVGNYFHTQWEAAYNGDSEYVPLFFPWWRHPEYTAEHAQLSLATGTLSAEERTLSAFLRVRGLNTVEIDSRVMWRRYAIRDLCQNDIQKFMQEYPATPEEAFISTGNNIFPHEQLKTRYQPVEGERGYIVMRDGQPKFIKSADGTAVVYKSPAKNRDYGRYMVAGDPTHTTRGDYAVIQVINRRTLEQVCRVRLKIDPINFAKELYAVARWYNDALLATETTGPGYATIGALLAMGYPYLYKAQWADKTPGSIADQYGFATNVQRKNWAIGALLNVIVEGPLVVHDSVTYSELVNYVSLDNGGYGPADGKGGHDDTVMALAIAVLCHLQEPPLPPMGENVPTTPWEDWMKDGSIQESFNAQVTGR